MYYSLVVFLPSVEQCLSILILLGRPAFRIKDPVQLFYCFLSLLTCSSNSSHVFLYVNVVHLVLIWQTSVGTELYKVWIVTINCFLLFCFSRVLVSPRQNLTRITLKGTFQGAKVVRGPDWEWGNQDGKLLLRCPVKHYSIFFFLLFFFLFARLLVENACAEQ